MPERTSSMPESIRRLTARSDGRLPGRLIGPSAMFEGDDDAPDCTDGHVHEPSVRMTPRALADIVNTAIHVGRNTETLATLATKLKPYGLRRKV